MSDSSPRRLSDERGLMRRIQRSARGPIGRQLESLAGSLVGTYKAFLEAKEHRTPLAILLVLLVTIVVSRLLSLSEVFDWIPYGLMSLVGVEVGRPPLPPVAVGGSFVFYLGALLGLFLFVRRVFGTRLELSKREVVTTVPLPRRALVLQFSPYRHRIPEQKVVEGAEAAQILYEQAIQTEGLEEMLRVVYRSNWGPPLYALLYHGEAVRTAWVLCTRESVVQANAFERLVSLAWTRRFGATAVVPQVLTSGENVEDAPHTLPVLDFTDLQHNALVVRHLYHERLERIGVSPRETIYDYTGGSSAITGGALLALSEMDAAVQYCKTGFPSPLLPASGPLLGHPDDGVLVEASTLPTSLLLTSRT